MSRPNFDTEIYPLRGGPVQIVTIRPLITGATRYQPTLYMRTVGETLRARTFAKIREDYPRLGFNQLRNVHGILQMNNIARGDERHAHTSNVLLRNINTDLIMEIFERAKHAGSNPTLELQEVEFAFWINPLSVAAGAGACAGLGTMDGLVAYSGSWVVQGHHEKKFLRRPAIVVRRRGGDILAGGPGRYEPAPCENVYIHGIQDQVR